MTTWATVLVASVASFVVKLLGHGLGDDGIGDAGGGKTVEHGGFL